MFVAAYEGQRLALMNPEIVAREGEERGREACLSLPGYVGEDIRRAARIVVKRQNVRGKPLRLADEGWYAPILQHEIDHLDGILFTDHLDRPGTLHAVRAPVDRPAVG